MKLYEPSRCSTSSRRTASQRSERSSSFDFSRMMQSLLGVKRQAVQLAHHEIHYVFRVPPGMDATEVPGPSRLLVIEREQTVFGERVKKLNQEKRIAGGLLVHQLRQCGGARRFTAQRIGNELSHVFTGEGRQADLLHDRSRLIDRFELPHQRMREG